MWVSLPDGNYGRDLVHAPQANPYWELKCLLPMGDKRYKSVRVSGGFAESVTDIVELPRQKTQAEELAEARAEIAALKATIGAPAPRALFDFSELSEDDLPEMGIKDLRAAAKGLGLGGGGSMATLREKLAAHLAEQE